MKGPFQFRTVEVYVGGVDPVRTATGYRVDSMPGHHLREVVELAKRDVEVAPGLVLSATEVRELSDKYTVSVSLGSFVTPVSQAVFDACQSEVLSAGTCVDMDADTYYGQLHPGKIDPCDPDAPVEPSVADEQEAPVLRPVLDGRGIQASADLDVHVTWRPTTVAEVDKEMERIRNQLTKLRLEREKLAAKELAS